MGKDALSYYRCHYSHAISRANVALDLVLRRRFGTRTMGNMLSIRHTQSPQDKFAVLNCRRLPARLNTSETALLLGLHDHDIATLVAAKLLLPLGKPTQNAPKYFAAIEVTARAEDREWLSNATKALARHWQAKNGRRSANCVLKLGATKSEIR